MSASSHHPARAAVAALVVAGTVGGACGSSASPDTEASEPPSTEMSVTTPSEQADSPPAATEAPAATEMPAETVELTQTTSPTAACPDTGEEWEVAKLYIEHNATDQDTGVHGLFGGEAWSVLCLWDPNGVDMLVADPLENFDRLTVSDLFFESREPPNAEYPVSQAFADFPEGDYTVAGIDFEGVARVGSARFTHDVPAAPTITFPDLAGDAESADESIVPTGDLVVTWEPVSEAIDGAPVDITGYQVIVVDEESEDPNGWSRPVFDVHVPAEQLSLTVPADWLRPATLYELEVLAIEASGNQTISVGFFTTS